MVVALRLRSLCIPIGLVLGACSSGEPPTGVPRATAVTHAFRSADRVPPALRAATIGAIQREAGLAHDLAPIAGGFRAKGSSPGLRADFTAQAAWVTRDDDGSSWTWKPTAARWGCEGDLVEVELAAPEAAGNRATYRRRGLDEWFVNGPLGLEHGFTLPAAPACGARGGGALVIELEGGPDLRASIRGDGRAAVLRDDSGAAALHYSDLHAVDARGHELPAELRAGSGGLSIHVDDRGASYPVTIDPLLWVENGALDVPDLQSGDQLGCAIAISGDTAIAGTFQQNQQHGAAYVFERAGGVWSQTQKLETAAGSTSGFGLSVALEGDTALIGAPTTDTWGVVYAFQRSAGVWSQVDELTSGYAQDGDRFGWSLALSGDTAIVGAYSAYKGAGSAYVFERSGSTWTQTQRLAGSDVVEGDEFGTSVTLEGDTALIGVPFAHKSEGAAYVFERSGSTWIETQKLTVDDATILSHFGSPAALSGDTALIAAPGDFYAWTQGAAYVFTRSGSVWSQGPKLQPSDGGPTDAFGSSLALRGGVALIGGWGVDTSQGAAYMFTRTGTTWSEQQKITPADGQPWDLFGTAVAMSDDAAIVSSYGKGPDLQGGLYTFTLIKAESGEACSGPNECQSGACRGGICCQTDCAADACHAATCAPGTGACAITQLADGSACGEAQACSQGSICLAGVCHAGAPVSCEPSDECHEAGTCDPATGACSNPITPDGTPCTSGVCEGGACTARAEGGRPGGDPARPSSPEPSSFGGCAVSPDPAPGSAALGMVLGLLLTARRQRRDERG